MLEKLDYTLVFSLFILFAISCVTLYIASVSHVIGSVFWKEQIVFYACAAPVAVAAALIDLDIFERTSGYIYGLCLLLLIGILVLPSSIAPELNGAKGWYHLGPVSLQPVEFMKIGLILMLSRSMSRFIDASGREMGNIKDEIKLFLRMVVYIIPLVYVAKAFPDMGSLLVYSAIFVALLFLSKIRLRIFMLFLIPASALIGFCAVTYFLYPHFFFTKMLAMLPSYQSERFYGWLDAGKYTNSDGFQLQSALKTIGSGQFSGMAHLDTSVPYAYSDFVFTIIGGSRGFIGAAVVVLTYFVMIYRMTRITMNYQGHFGQFVGVGIIAMFSYQIFQNIGMTLGLLPITGLSLPFISYGGSSLIVSMVAAGLMINLNLHTHDYMF